MGKETMADDQPTKSAIRSLRWFIGNGAFATCIYLGFVKEIKGAEDVAIFWAWALAVISIFLMSDLVINELKKKKPPVPLWLDGIFDIIIVSVFVWFGAIATAIAYLIYFIFLQAAWEKALKESSKVPSDQTDDQPQFGEITEEK